MNTIIYARRELVDLSRHSGVATPPGIPSTLLEGAWPEEGYSHERLSLDETIDARFGWIDEEAERLAALATGDADRDANHGPLTAAWINALPLRYYMLKLVRVIAFFTDLRPLERDDVAQLIVADHGDDDYIDLIAWLCQKTGCECRVTRIGRPPEPEPAFPPNPRWRRWATRLSRYIEPPTRRTTKPRVVLCGNPRLLDPVCGEFLRQDCRVWWLYDRFASKTWLRWRPRGVGQLVCQSSLSDENRIGQPDLPPLVCREIDLSVPVGRWIEDRIRTHGRCQTRIVDRIDAHFRRIKPDALVLDQDATPFARATVGLARKYGSQSFVVQHGAPLSRFGFAPLAADRILAWGQSSRRTLLRWGMANSRIQITGSPCHDRLARSFSLSTPKRPSRRKERAPEILLLATVPPRDSRPDGVELHLTRSTYAKMLHNAFQAVERVPNATLIIKLHPRSPNDPRTSRLLGQFDRLKTRLVTGGPVETWIAKADCVLSCISSAGIDATLAGVPVIQLLPADCGNVLPADEWGLLGSATDGIELERLLAEALALERTPPGREPGDHHGVFHRLDGSSAARIAETVLTSCDSPPPQHNSTASRRSPSRCSPTPVHYRGSHCQ